MPEDCGAPKQCRQETWLALQRFQNKASALDASICRVAVTPLAGTDPRSRCQQLRAPTDAGLPLQCFMERTRQTPDDARSWLIWEEPQPRPWWKPMSEDFRGDFHSREIS